MRLSENDAVCSKSHPHGQKVLSESDKADELREDQRSRSPQGVPGPRGSGVTTLQAGVLGIYMLVHHAGPDLLL